MEGNGDDYGSIYVDMNPSLVYFRGLQLLTLKYSYFLFLTK